MDLKLKDTITSVIIKNPGISINEIAKKTKNYYSYVHKIILKMEKEKLVRIEKKNNSTKVFIINEYKSKWISDIEELLESLKKNAEIIISFIVMYSYIAYNYFKPKAENAMLAVFDSDLAERTYSSASPIISENLGIFLVLMAVPALILIWYYRNFISNQGLRKE